MEEKLIFARWAQKWEVDQFISQIKKRNDREYQKSLSYLNHHKGEILNQYKILDERFKNLIKESEDLKTSLEYALQNDCCTCGSDIRHIDQYNFWGCVNYKDQSTKHYNFRNSEDPYEYIDRLTFVDTSKWVTSLKHKCVLPKSVKISSLFKFIKENGLPCINEKYTGESVELKMNNFRNAIKKGVDFEYEVKDILSRKSDRLYYQQYIKYQYAGHQHMYAVPDFILVTDKMVTIYECKVDESLCDDRNRQLYIDLVSFILKEKGMAQKISFIYAFKNKGMIFFKESN